MLKMRLQKRGRRRSYHSRIVVTEARRGTHSGNYVDMIGSYDHKQGTITLDKEKAAEWIAKGVQPSVTVHNMLVSEGVLKADKKNPLPKKTAPVVEQPEEEEAPAAPDEAPAEEVAEETAEEAAPAAEEEEAPTETKEEAPAPEPETTEEAPAEETTEEETEA